MTSSPAGLTCTGGFGQTCTGTFPVGTIVTLTASPSGTHTFSGWGGACAGQGCTVELAGDRLVVAGFTNPPSLVLRFYHTDAIGSVRAITDEARQVLERFDYGPFGEGVGVTPTSSPLRFSGKTRDVESALDYFGARYYAARIGQFTTVDPALNVEAAMTDPQRWNRFVYARNSPPVFVDPDGRDVILAVSPLHKELMRWAGGIRDRVATALGSGASHEPRAVFGRWVVDALLATVLPRDEAELAQATNAAIFGAVLPLGPSPLARAFGFVDAAEAGSFVGGRLANGAQAAVSFARIGDTLAVNISMVSAGGAKGTLQALEAGAINAARAAGATRLRLVATNPTERMLNFLKRKGFIETKPGIWISEVLVK